MTGPRHLARFSAASVTAAEDGRLFSRTFERNFEPIREALVPYFAKATGTVLEIGGGTGQHGAHLAAAFGNLSWLPSDIEPAHRASAMAWATYLGVENQKPPIILDATTEWSEDFALITPLAGVLSCNVIHIAPWAVTEGIVRGAGKTLDPGGALIFYGPFKEAGRHTGEGNANFDAGLRADNPAWGIRDIDKISLLAKAAGLGPAEVTHMPSNNRLVAFRRA